MTIECFVRRAQPEAQTGLFNHPIPAPDTGHCIPDVIVAQHFIERIQQRDFAFRQCAVGDFQDVVMTILQHMVIIALGFFIAAFQTGAIESRRVRGLVGAEQINRDTEMKVQVTLDGRQINHALGAYLHWVFDAELFHDSTSTGNHA